MTTITREELWMSIASETTFIYRRRGKKGQGDKKKKKRTHVKSLVPKVSKYERASMITDVKKLTQDKKRKSKEQSQREMKALKVNGFTNFSQKKEQHMTIEEAFKGVEEINRKSSKQQEKLPKWCKEEHVAFIWYLVSSTFKKALTETPETVTDIRRAVDTISLTKDFVVPSKKQLWALAMNKAVQSSDQVSVGKPNWKKFQDRFMLGEYSLGVYKRERKGKSKTGCYWCYILFAKDQEIIDACEPHLSKVYSCELIKVL